MPSLEMIVAQDRSSHDRQVSVRSQEIVRESLDKVKELAESVVVDRHGNVAGVEHDAVLIVVDIRGILESPGTALDSDRNDPVVLSGRMIHSAVISLVLNAQLALGITALGGVSCRGDRLGILLRLGEIDSDIEFAVLRLSLPPSVFGDPVSSDIICIPGEIIIPVGRPDGIFIVNPAELRDDFTRSGCQNAHDLRIEEIPHDHGRAVYHPLFGRVIKDHRQDFLQESPVRDLLPVERRRSPDDLGPVPGIIVDPERPQQGIDCVDHIFFRDQFHILSNPLPLRKSSPSYTLLVFSLP